MELRWSAVEAEVGAPGVPGRSHAVSIAERWPRFSVPAGPVVVSVRAGDDGFDWSVANQGDRPVALWSVSVVARLEDVSAPLRMFRHGYQSWSPAGVATFGVDADPSVRADFPFVQGVYHADGRRAGEGELRSEWCTALACGGAAGGRVVVLGFDGGHLHDGTFRLRRGSDGGPELVLEAHLGGIVLGAGEERPLHGVSWSGGEQGEASALLAGWASRVGRAEGARVDTPFVVGWCSWYHFFDEVTEGDLRRNLAAAAAGGWPFDVFQLDDGYQAAVGDWRETNSTFPSALERLAADVAATGMRPGLWLAPFLAAPDSELVRRHPEWVARLAGADGATPHDEPLRSWWNPSWGGGEDGFMYSLDTTHPEVLAHLEQLARDLVEAGFAYLKLDFTFAPSVEGRWHDPTRTPAQRVRAGFEAIRRGAGTETVLLGCGVPLSNVVGVVDANRIGPDVAPRWTLEPSEEIVPGYLDVQPATRSAFAATAARSFMHRQLWANDPDCVMLRTEDTELGTDAALTWERCVGLSGGLVMVSDDLALLGADARARLDEVVALGRESDALAVGGDPPRCADLLEHRAPARLVAGRRELVADLDAATSELRIRPE
jgi:alpha-galactosidase